MSETSSPKPMTLRAAVQAENTARVIELLRQGELSERDERFAKSMMLVWGLPDPTAPEPDTNVVPLNPGDKRPSVITDETFSAVDLAGMEFEPVSYRVPHLLPRKGLTLLVGAPKQGKSWLALDLAIAVASGGQALHGLETEHPCGVLYLSPDDTNKARLKERMLGILGDRPAPPGLDLLARDFGSGREALEAIVAYMHGSKGATTEMIVLDTMGSVAIDREPGESVYHSERRFMTALRGLTDSYSRHISFLVVHHTRKGQSEDGIEAVSGTNAVAGGADHVLTLTAPDRRAKGRRLEVNSRDEMGGAFTLTFGEGSTGLYWRPDLDPDGVEQYLTADDQAIYRAVERFEGPATAADLADTGLVLSGPTKLGDRLNRLAKRGHLRRTGRGMYLTV